MRLIVLLLLATVLRATEAIPEEATVFLDGQPIVVLRATIAGHGPEERATIIHQRLHQVVDQPGSGAIAHEAVPDGILLRIDGSPVLLLVPDDAQRVIGETLDTVVDKAEKALAAGLGEHRQPLSGRNLWLTLLEVALATVAYAAVITAVVWIARNLRRLVTALAHAVGKRIAHREIGAFIRDQLSHLIRLLVVLCAWGFALGATSIWLSAVLLRFPATRAVGENMRGALGGWMWELLGRVARTMPDLGVVVVIVLITATLAHIVRLFFDRIERKRIQLGWLNAHTAIPTRRITTVALWLFAAAMAYPYIPGSNSEAFKGLSVLVGLMVSLGASGLVGQAASGFIVTYLGVIRVGDYVKVGDTEGTVAAIGIFTTRIETVFKEAVSVPNVLLFGNQLLNYSRFPGDDGVVVRAKVTIGYSTPWRQVHALLEEAARRVGDLRSEPKAYVLQRALSDFYVEYELCAHLTEPVKRIPVLDELHRHIQDLCNEQGIQILSPHWMADPPIHAAKPVPG